MNAHCCAYCSRWFVGQSFVKSPLLPAGALISHGICPDCFIVQTAQFRPTTLAGWLAESRTTADDILAALASPGLAQGMDRLTAHSIPHTGYGFIPHACAAL